MMTMFAGVLNVNASSDAKVRLRGIVLQKQASLCLGGMVSGSNG